MYTLWGAKNMLRIFKAGFSENLTNTEHRLKFSYSYKKKCVIQQLMKKLIINFSNSEKSG